MDVLTQALKWLAQGIAVIPIAYRSKLPDATALKWTNREASWIRYQHTLPTERELRIWTAGPRINLAVVTGWQGLVVIDFDSMAAWQGYQAVLTDATRSVTTATYTVSTGRGMHLYVKCAEPVRNGHVGAIDIKAAGGYVITPPSVHPSGRVYTAVNPDAPILTVERFADIFPLELTTNEAPSGAAVPRVTEQVTQDPYASAENVAPHSIEHIKRACRIEDLFTDLVPTGRGWFQTKCPLHDDTAPSFWIDTQRQLCGCYAGCTNKPLDIINLYARLYGLSNREAIFQLARTLH